MLCEKCKMREANIQYTEIVNGEKKDHYFCIECAKNMDFSQISNILEGDFPLAKLLSGLLSRNQSGEKTGDYVQLSCPNCGTTYQDFVNNSRFGCADCYEVFDLMMGDTIKKLQGSDAHRGKRPKYHIEAIPENVQKDLAENAASVSKTTDPAEAETAQKLLNLKQQLKSAIANEEYEEAARIRDEIKALKPEGGE